MLTVTISQSATNTSHWQQQKSAQSGQHQGDTTTTQTSHAVAGSEGDESALSPRLDSDTTSSLLDLQQDAPSHREIQTAMDSNRDGVVDSSELAAYATLPPASPPPGAGGVIPQRTLDDMAKPDEELEAVIAALSEDKAQA